MLVTRIQCRFPVQDRHVHWLGVLAGRAAPPSPTIAAARRILSNSSTADHATITNNGGWTEFNDNSKAGNATINNASGERAALAGDAAESGDAGLWGEGFGLGNRADGDGNAAGAQSTTAGFLIGGYSRTDLDIPDRLSASSGDNYHLGVYAGVQGEALALRTALTHSRHRLSVRRNIAYAGVSERLQADEQADTTGLFAELAYTAGGLEPYLQLAASTCTATASKSTAGWATGRRAAT